MAPHKRKKQKMNAYQLFYTDGPISCCYKEAELANSFVRTKSYHLIRDVKRKRYKKQKKEK